VTATIATRSVEGSAASREHREMSIVATTGRSSMTLRLFGWPAVAIGFMIAGAVTRVFAGEAAARMIWMIGLAVAAAPIAWQTVRDARHGRFATDIVATMAIVGALILGQPIAGLVVVLMKRGGDALERYAEGRASAAVRTLEEAAPRIAHRIDDHAVSDVPATAIAIGELLLVRPGELIPCDGVVEDGMSDLDTSQLTGEPIPVVAMPGTAVMSGSANGTGVLRVRTTAIAEQSQYARIVELVRTAQSHKAPLQRLADRYATWFTPATILMCVVAYLASRDWTRVLAVLVVATPCPLILATPVAFVGGINRAARRHIIVRTGAALEQLSAVTTVVFDKTGTITVGEPRLDHIETLPGWTPEELLRLASGVEQGSSHRLARVIVDATVSRGIQVPAATLHNERPGQGAVGKVEGREIHIGSRSFVLSNCVASATDLAQLEVRSVPLRAFVGVNGKLAGAIEYADELREDVPVVIADLERLGIDKMVLLSGDHAPSARAMARRAGITDARGDLMPQDKSTVVQTLMEKGETVMMVGDGTNDAPALTAASVGVALAGHGGGITAEAADVIILRDSLSAVSEIVAIGRRTMRIARQSIWVGLGLSAAAMVWAAMGGIAPVPGALLQEAIDVAVIVNALRTVRGSP
jgi:heavy metal translocating P-type ATPase